MNDIQMRKMQNVFYTMETGFKYLLLTLTMLSFCSLTAHSPVLTGVSYITALLGTVLLLNRVIHCKSYMRFYGLAILVCFGLSYAISSLINIEYGLVENIQAMVWMAFQYGLLYAMDVTEPEKQGRKTYLYLLNYFIIFIGILNIVSIGMLFADFGRTFATSFNGNIMGYVWGRLWGAYSDPNVGAVLCVAAMVISVCYSFEATKKWQKVLYILNVILAFMYLCFSDSRTGMVCFAITLFVFAYFLLKARSKLRLKSAAKEIVCLLLAAAITITGIIAIPLFKSGYNAAAKAIYEFNYGEVSDDPDSPTDISPDDKPTIPAKPNIIERTGDELDEDISNRRFDLWKSGVEIWQKAPIFGTSFRALQPFAEKNLPDTYMVDNDAGVKFASTHNALVDLLVSQGLVGAVIFLAFIVCIVMLVVKKMLPASPNTFCTIENILILALITNLAASAIFIPDLIYINSAAAVLFWMSLGRLVKNLKYGEVA